MVEPRGYAAGFAEALKRPTVFITGKGGVGKTAVAAALAEHRRARGERVLLVEIDHASPSLGQIYGIPETSGTTAVDERLHVTNVRWKDSLTDYLNESLPGKRAASVLLGFRATRRFLEALPFAREAVLLRALVRLHHEPFDAMIVDLPASGHALALFSTARSLTRVFGAGTLIRRQSEEIEELFGSAHAGLLITAIPEEMSVTETVETAAKFKELSFPPLLSVLLNRFPVDAIDADLRPAVERLLVDLDEESRAWEAASSALSEIKHRARSDKALERLQAALKEVRILPLLPEAGRDLVRGLAESLDAA